MPAEGQPKFSFHLHGTAYTVSQPVIEGLQVRVLAQIARPMELVLEGQHEIPDRVIHDTDPIDLTKAAAHFYVKPPTSFG